MPKSPTQRILAGCGICLLILLAILVGLVLGLSRLDRNDPGAVSMKFVWALIDNDITTAKSLTAPEHWHRLDAWGNEHDAFRCSFSLDPDDLGGHGIGSGGEEAGVTIYDWVYFCAIDDYHLAVDSIVLERSEDGFVVTGWGKICESWQQGNMRTCSKN